MDNEEQKQEQNQLKEQAKATGKQVAQKGAKTALKALAPLIIKIVAVLLLVILFVSAWKIILNNIISAVMDAVSGDGTSYYTVDESDGSIHISDSNIEALIQSIEALGIDLDDIHLMGDLADYTDEDVQERNKKALKKYIRRFYEAQAITETLNYKPNAIEAIGKTFGRVYVNRVKPGDTDISQVEQLEYIPYEQLTGIKLPEKTDGAGDAFNNGRDNFLATTPDPTPTPPTDQTSTDQDTTQTDDETSNQGEQTTGGQTANNSLDNFLFIGDSRTRGAKTELEKLGSNITVCGVDSSAPKDWVSVTQTGGPSNVLSSSIKLPEASQVKGISVALGVNNTGDDKNMKKVLDNLLARYPDVTIYVNSVFHVGTTYHYNEPIATNSGIDKFNNEIKKYCDSKDRLMYIDITNGLYDSSGYLKSEYVNQKDGLHLSSTGNIALAENIKIAITGNAGSSGGSGSAGGSYQGNVVHPKVSNPMKYFSVNGNGELVVLGTRTTLIQENRKTLQNSVEYVETIVNYKSAISQYTTTVTFLVSLTLATGNPEFVSALVDLIEEGKIEITVMDNFTQDKTTITTPYTVHTKERVKEQIDRETGSAVYDVKTSNKQGTYEKVEKISTLTPNPQITYVKTWFCEQTIQYKKDTTTSPVTQTQGSSPASQPEPALPSGESSASWTTYGSTTIKVEQTTSSYTESVKGDVIDKTGEKGDQGLNADGKVDEKTTMLGLLDDKFKIPNTSRKEFAGQNLMSDADIFFDLLQQDQSLQNLEMVMRYVMYKYTGRDYGVTELDFSIFQTNTIQSGGIGMGMGVVGNTVEEKVWYTLRNAGYSEYAVAGVMGNIYGESHFDPAIIERGNGVGFGLCQWSYGRRTALENYARAKGVSASDVDTQIEYLLGELSPKGGCSGYAKYQLMTVTRGGKTYRPNDWLNANSPENAAVAFCYTFERPKAYDNIRSTKAREYYEKFKGKTMAASSGIFWWPIGSVQTTNSNGATFASGAPSATGITSGFGPRVPPTPGASDYHRGIDIGSGGKGSGYHNVIASANGKVVLVHTSSSGQRGCYVKIDHGNGIQTISQHLAAGSITVRQGQVVQQGQVIAKMGNTGIGTGAHLHFEVHENGTPVNPVKYVNNTRPRP